jgi:hypothetical protein
VLHPTVRGDARAAGAAIEMMRRHSAIMQTKAPFSEVRVMSGAAFMSDARHRIFRLEAHAGEIAAAI